MITYIIATLPRDGSELIKCQILYKSCIKHFKSNGLLHAFLYILCILCIFIYFMYRRLTA